MLRTIYILMLNALRQADRHPGLHHRLRPFQRCPEPILRGQPRGRKPARDVVPRRPGHDHVEVAVSAPGLRRKRQVHVGGRRGPVAAGELHLPGDEQERGDQGSHQRHW